MEIKRYFFLISLLLVPFITTKAQQNEENDTPSDPPRLYDSIIGFLPESLDANMHRLLEEWHVMHFSKPEEFCEDEDVNPYFPD